MPLIVSGTRSLSAERGCVDQAGSFRPEVRVPRLRRRTFARPGPFCGNLAATAGLMSALGDKPPGDPSYLAIRI
jgi:hypothetical protein